MRHSVFAALIAPLAIFVWLHGAIAQPTPAPTPSSSPSPKFTPYPDLDQLGCYWATDHEAADLCAQWQAARAAQQAANSTGNANIISTIALIVSGLGMIGLFFTLYQTNLSLAEARKAAKAAEDAVKETQRIGEAQVRCYLVIESALFRINSKINHPILQLKINNVGQSPAKATKFKVSLAYSPAENLTDRRTEIVEEFDHARTMYLAPNAAHTFPRVTYEIPISPEEAAMVGKNLAVVVMIQVRATDVFGKHIRLVASFACLNVEYDKDITLDHIAHMDTRD